MPVKTSDLRVGDEIRFTDHVDVVEKTKYVGGVVWRIDVIRYFRHAHPCYAVVDAKVPTHTHFYSGDQALHYVTQRRDEVS